MKIIIKTTILALALGIGISDSSAQTPQSEDRETNFGFSQNPPVKTSRNLTNQQLSGKREYSDIGAKATVDNTSVAGAVTYESVVNKSAAAGEKESAEDVKPTEIYRVGKGDVLFISLQNSKSNNFTVANDGSIDYPLAGGAVIVRGLTVDDIAGLLRERVKLFKNPEVVVKVKKHTSHAVEVTGMAVRTGKQYLQREAMPLYVVRARAIAESGATLVLIKRGEDDEMVIRSGTEDYDNTLIYPGDVIEFSSAEKLGSRNGYIFLDGAVNNAGRFTFFKGTTLTQAIETAGGPLNRKAKKAVISRINDDGRIKRTSYKFKDIRKGRIADPELQPGDRVEVRR